MKIFNKQNSRVFSEEELKEINNLRSAFEECTDREKFVLKEALEPYFKEMKT